MGKCAIFLVLAIVVQSVFLRSVPVTQTLVQCRSEQQCQSRVAQLTIEGQSMSCLKLVPFYYSKSSGKQKCQPVFENEDVPGEHYFLVKSFHSINNVDDSFMNELRQQNIAVRRVGDMLAVRVLDSAQLEVFETATPQYAIEVEWLDGNSFQMSSDDHDVEPSSFATVDTAAKLEMATSLNATIYETVIRDLSGASSFPWAMVTEESSRRPELLFQSAMKSDGDDGVAMANLPTRYSYSDELKLARDYIVHFLTSLDIFNDVQIQPFKMLRNGREAWNVIARIEGTENPGEAVLIGAHYDSTSEKPLVRAPGAIDDGSGTAGVMTIAHALARLLKRQNKKGLSRTVLFGLFAGEEQGLVGSKYYVRHLLPANIKITNAILMDMVGYSDRYYGVKIEGTRDATIQKLMNKMAGNTREYAPELEVALSHYSFGSDHVSFQNAGIPAVLVIERDDTDYAEYHKSTDTVDHLDIRQALDILRGLATTLLDLC